MLCKILFCAVSIEDNGEESKDREGNITLI